MKTKLFQEKKLIFQRLSAGPEMSSQNQKPQEELKALTGKLKVEYDVLKKEISDSKDWSEASINSHESRIATFLAKARKQFTQEEYSDAVLNWDKMKLHIHLYEQYEKARSAKNSKLEKNNALYLLAKPEEALLILPVPSSGS